MILKQTGLQCDVCGAQSPTYPIDSSLVVRSETRKNLDWHYVYNAPRGKMIDMCGPCFEERDEKPPVAAGENLHNWTSGENESGKAIMVIAETTEEGKVRFVPIDKWVDPEI